MDSMGEGFYGVNRFSMDAPGMKALHQPGKKRVVFWNFPHRSLSDFDEKPFAFTVHNEYFGNVQQAFSDYEPIGDKVRQRTT
jgi:hypothetical protein